MFEYKNNSFFNEYFSSLPDFTLSQAFELDKDNKDLYIGKIESVGTVHPMSIKVEIPTTFPHSKLLFWTDSLRCYPHLIIDTKRKESWFCLNTPFAESVEEQLEQEMIRLRDWIRRFVRKDLPKVIKDPDVYKALYMMNAYSWENIDEMNGYRQDARLTFIGDFATHKDYFKKEKGKFYCVKNTSERIFVLRDKFGTNFELPYIIVDNPPIDFDFVALKEQFGWDEDTCDFLLPGLQVGKSDYSWGIWRHLLRDLTEDEANQKLDDIEKELQKEDCVLKTMAIRPGGPMSLRDCHAKSKVPESHKAILLDLIKGLRKTVKEENGYKSATLNISDIDLESMTEEEQEEYEAKIDEAEYYAEKNQFELHHFALGVIEGERITWHVVSTNKVTGTYDETSYDLAVCQLIIRHTMSKGCDTERAQIVTEKEYFGRGMFSDRWSEKKVCVVGVGAIGSLVCESLARSGVSVLAIWDDDTVEPGNLCRSTYHVQDIGQCKIRAVCENIVSINPFVDLETITTKGIGEA